MQASLPSSVERNVAEEACLVSAPREHGQRHRNWYVDADLADLNLTLKFASSRTRLSKDGRSVSVLVRIDNGKRIIQGISRDNSKDRPEDLLSLNGTQVLRINADG